MFIFKFAIKTAKDQLLEFCVLQFRKNVR
jgi:hypothetical protein